MGSAPPVYYPPVGFYFQVTVGTIGGANESNFQEASGLNVTLGTEEVKEGGENQFVYRLPTPPKYQNLVLKRGMVTNSALISWAKNTVENFKFTTKTVVVSLLDSSGNPLATWSFNGAYPVSIKISDMKAQDNSVVVETIEFAYTNFTRTK